MTELEKEPTTVSTQTAEARPLPAGELKMLALLFVICAALLADALRSPGVYQGVSAGPGSIPQIVAGALVVMVLGLAVSHLRKGYREGSLRDLVHYLFDREVVLLIVTVSIYGLIIEPLGFVPSTVLFLVGTMFLLDPSGNALEFKAFADIAGQLFAK